MSKGSGYIMLDKNLAQSFKEIRREFSVIEAMFSYSLDQDKGLKGSIKGYAVLWGWSRNRVRRFLDLIRTGYGHPGDTRRTPYGHPIHFIDKDLWPDRDSQGTVNGHPTDTLRTPTSNPIILDPNPKEKDMPKNTKKEYPQFEEFWDMYDKKSDRKKCLSKFNKLKQSDIDLIFKNLPAYVESTPDPQYRKNPITYLNNESWNDQIIPKGKLNGKAKNYTGPDTREPVIPDRMPEY